MDLNKIYHGYIYALHGKDGEIRYIGCTVQTPRERLMGHKRAAKSGIKRYVCQWIESEGPDSISIKVLEEFDQISYRDLLSVEREYIASARLKGVRLTNLADGGGGTPGSGHNLGKKHTQEFRDGVSARMTGSIHDAETRKKMSESQKARYAANPSLRKTNMKAAVAAITPESRMKAQETRRANGGIDWSHHVRWCVKNGKDRPQCVVCYPPSTNAPTES